MIISITREEIVASLVHCMPGDIEAWSDVDDIVKQLPLTLAALRDCDEYTAAIADPAQRHEAVQAIVRFAMHDCYRRIQNV